MCTASNSCPTCQVAADKILGDLQVQLVRPYPERSMSVNFSEWNHAFELAPYAGPSAVDALIAPATSVAVPAQPVSYPETRRRSQPP